MRLLRNAGRALRFSPTAVTARVVSVKAKRRSLSLANEYQQGAGRDPRGVYKTASDTMSFTPDFGSASAEILS